MTNSAWKTPHFPFPAPSVTRNSRPKLVNVRQHLSDCWPVFLIEGSLLSISVFVRKNNIRFLEEREKKKKKDLSLKISKRINYNKNWNETLKSFHKNNICDSSKKKKKEKEEAALELDPDRELGKYRGKLITTKTGTNNLENPSVHKNNIPLRERKKRRGEDLPL